MKRLASMLFLSFVLFSAEAKTAQAQCMACISSHACGESSTRGGCSVMCVGTQCACADDGDCKPKPTRFYEPVSEDGRVGIYAVRAQEGLFVVAACGERSPGVTFSASKMKVVQEEMRTIALGPPDRAIVNSWVTHVASVSRGDKIPIARTEGRRADE